MQQIKTAIYRAVLFLATPLIIILFYIFAILSRIIRSNNKEKPHLVWGSAPIINNAYHSKAMKSIGFESETFTTDFYSNINERTDWDKILSEEYKWIPKQLKPFIAFIHSLFRYDVFLIPVSGFFIGSTPICFWQAQILKIANKKVIVLPYGSDSYIYQRIRSTGTIHGLLMSYPQAAKEQKKISKNVDYWCTYADAILPGTMGPDGFGRWDILVPSALSLDLKQWHASKKMSSANGTEGKVIIAHAPNHRGFKGSEFVIDAVQKLQAEGLNIELRLLEKIKNHEVRRILNEDADILVEQLIATGHGLNALEGMASGLPTISNLEDEAYIMPLRRWSYFNECPLVSASPETLIDVLRKLITRPELRHQLGKASREYVEKYHGLDSTQYLFSNVIDYVYGKKESLINLYHPLLGEYPNRSPKIQHPLFKNRIVD